MTAVIGTWQHSWGLETKLGSRLDVATAQAAGSSFVSAGCMAGRPLASGCAPRWLLDGSSVVDYDIQSFGEVSEVLKHLGRAGLRYVALVHPSSLVDAAVSMMAIPGVTMRAFSERSDAAAWLSHLSI